MTLVSTCQVITSGCMAGTGITLSFAVGWRAGGKVQVVLIGATMQGGTDHDEEVVD